jgi:hypothetical protein
MTTGEMFFAIWSGIGSVLFILGIFSAVQVAKGKDLDPKTGTTSKSWIFFNWPIIWTIYTTIVLLVYGILWIINLLFS